MNPMLNPEWFQGKRALSYGSAARCFSPQEATRPVPGAGRPRPLRCERATRVVSAACSLL